MPEKKNVAFDRPGGYAMPTGGTARQRADAALMAEADIRLCGDALPRHEPVPQPRLRPAFSAADPDTRVYIGDCRDVLASLPERGQVDLVFADPPFNWDVPYEQWQDGMPREEYERFTYDWLDGCIEALAPHGSLWVNVPDDTAAEIVVHLKRRGLTMINWCVWHFRFGQHRESSFILSKVHALYFAKNADERTWNQDAILEPSDRASIYGDPRTMSKERNRGMRVPMDVWYGKYWGRIQGNNKERRHRHHNQIPETYLERVILACSNEGDLVLDPFLGSGTTGTVARAYNRRSIGIEFSEGNAGSAWERITKVGMIRQGAAVGQSSAIFKSRRRSGSAGKVPNGTNAPSSQRTG
ncbi:MAG: DNA-methyltransferase [Planctomycetota bacterium]|jgi:site-specific DNA-methyltransferase (adenine-specific)